MQLKRYSKTEKGGLPVRGLHSGFTLLEFIVVFALVGTLSAITLYGYRESEGETVLNNLAQDIAISIRTAQSYGLNVKSGAGGSFETTYGMHFDKDFLSNYRIYSKVRGSGYQYAGGGSSVELFTLNPRYEIYDICLTGGATTHCFRDAGPETLDVVDIAFDRPKPDANFVGSEGGAINGTSYEQALITIEGPTGSRKSVRVNLTGYISVE